MHDLQAEIVDVSTASMLDVVQQYLDESPPFGFKDKKHEFPDAIVISALAKWAATKGEEIYVITRDEAFRQACDDEDDLYPLMDVSDFLSKIAGHEEIASARITKAFGLRRAEIVGLIRDKFAGLTFYLDADIGDGDAELDSVEEIKVEGEPEIIDLNESTATVEIVCDVSFTAEASFEDPNTGFWDSEDQVMLFMQTKRVNVRRVESMTVEVLLQFEKAEDLANPEKIDICVVDLSPDPTGVHATENPDLNLYERAMELFNACNFQAARESFFTLTKSMNRDLAYSAGLRVKMCNRRLGNL